jgi:hypothetical protein
MKLLRGIFNGKAALQAVDLSDILISISDDERKKLQKIILDIYKDIFGGLSTKWMDALFGRRISPRSNKT